ncbi:MAG: hypothetical protein U0324_04330 [Polyangiales bacterium]
MNTTCAECNSSRTEAAAIDGAALRLDRSSTMKKVFNVGGVIHCVACLECGAITRLRADPKAMADALT